MCIITCKIHVVTCEIHVVTCEIHVITCEIHVITCEGHMITCEIHVIRHEIHVITCETDVIRCEKNHRFKFTLSHFHFIKPFSRHHTTKLKEYLEDYMRSEDRRLIKRLLLRMYSTTAYYSLYCVQYFSLPAAIDVLYYS